MTCAECRFLEWDSEFFGRRIARLDGGRLTAARLQAASPWWQDHKIECVYFLAESGDPPTVSLAEDHGFRFVDVRMTLTHTLLSVPLVPTPPLGVQIRPYAPSDIGELRAIASRSHRDSRFYADPRFTMARANALYETWIERACTDHGHAVLVPARDERPVGYVTCRLDEGMIGHIGLIAVADSAQGLGVGRALVAAALSWCRERGACAANVVTQGRNLPAQRLYQRSGFVSQSLELWYHRWFSATDPVLA